MEQTTLIDPMRAAAMHAMLGRDGPPPGPGAALPEFWHWTQFWMIAGRDELGRDGHPARGGFIPDAGLPRRMWAGGQVTFHQPIRIGAEATRVSTASPVTRKSGRSGPLAFVTVTHEIRQDETPCVTERQDLVFREDPDPDAPAPAPDPAPGEAETTIRHRYSATDLFRYSALTFNGHRIHYDIDYCRDVEGYPGLIVHGPLLAQCLVDLAVTRLGPLNRFRFRALSPVFHHESFTANCTEGPDGLDLWIAGEDGRLAMRAVAS